MLSPFMNDSISINTEFWFVPLDSFAIICVSLVIILATFFLFVIIYDKTCHTVPVMFVANSCLTALILEIDILWMSIFTLQNDLEQIQHIDSFYNIRGYLSYSLCALQNYSYLLEAFYRYILVGFPHKFFWQSARIQVLFICSSWIFALVYPLSFLFNGVITYDVDNQICQIPMRFSVSLLCAAVSVYGFPVLMTIFTYWKLIQCVKDMSNRVVLANALIRAKKELKMVRRLVLLLFIEFVIQGPYAFFVFISFFISPPKYHFRIGYFFINVSTISVMISLLLTTDSLKTSMKKIFYSRLNIITPTVA